MIGAAFESGHIALIGLMASGKSRVGRRVADTLDVPLVDVDLVIEGRTGMTVRELWERNGEAAYRPLERDAALAVLAAPGPDVLATPAGVVLDHLVREALQAADCFTVWLRAEPATLAGRVSASDHRPLLGPDPLATFRTMAEDRSAIYEGLADLVLDVEHQTPEQLAALVLDALEQRPASR